MRRILLLVLLLITNKLIHSQTVFWQDDFENAATPDIPAGSTRTPSNDGGTTLSYFKRSPNTAVDINLAPAFGAAPYGGMSGSNIWAGEDHDTPFGAPQQQIEWTGINISGKSTLAFRGLFAANNQNGAWDNGLCCGGSDPVGPGGINDFVIVEYAIDAGAYTQLIAFWGDGLPNAGAPTLNKSLQEDTNGDGVGDGTDLNHTLSEFIKSIPGAGTTMKLRITIYDNGGNEEWAIDNFRLTEVVADVTNPVITFCPSNPQLILVGAGCTIPLPDYTGTVTATDNVGVIGYFQVTSPTGTAAGTALNLGATLPVRVVARDAAGNEGTCTFNATGVSPEANLTGNGNPIADGYSTPVLADHTDFGSASVCSGTVVRTFTIQNAPGTAVLNISSVTITGANPGDFSVTAAPVTPIAISGSTTFNVTFNPTAMGGRTATINVNNDDCNEAVYDFAIQGTGVDPEANVQGNLVSIVDGDNTPSLADDTDFGNVNTGSSSGKIYTIQNTGTSNLNISSINSSNGLFVVSGISFVATVNGSSSTTFTVTFSPVAAGSQTSTITMASNDCDEASYEFDVMGMGVVAACTPVTCGVTSANENCAGNGTIDLTPSGTCTPFTVDWADIAGPSNSEDRSGLSAGTYSYIVTDNDGNTCSGSVMIARKWME